MHERKSGGGLDVTFGAKKRSGGYGGLRVPGRGRVDLKLRRATAARVEALENRTYLTDVFLQGNYVEVGIHDSGSFGTSTGAPTGYHPLVGGTRQLGFVADPGRDGWTVGSPAQTGDYFVPGTPEEGWALKWTTAGTSKLFGNFGLVGQVNVPKTSLTTTSSGDTLSAVWVGTATNGNDKLRVTQTVLFNKNDLFFVMDVVLTNIGTTTLGSLKYMRNVDPDQEQPLTGNFTTKNYVAFQPPHTGITPALPSGNTSKALVVAKGLNFGLTLGLGTIDPRATVSTEGFSNRDPDAILLSPVQPTAASPRTADEAIALAYDLASLAPGQSTTVDYAYILNEADLDIAMSRLGAVSILQPTGTVSGNQVAFQATTRDPANTSKVEFFVNGASIGVATTPDQFGVFGTTFDSKSLPDGPLVIKVVATFNDGTTQEKTTNVSVDNAGPPIALSTPLPGQIFSRHHIPIAVNVLDANKPPVRVSFFRETASTGSLFLGEDTSAPFASDFSSADLPDGETVNIKVVATDSLGRVTTLTVSGIARTNTAPVPIAGGVYTIDEGHPLTLDGSATTDKDADPLTYAWDLNGDGIFTDASGVKPTLSWAQLSSLGIAGGTASYPVTLRVDDGEGHVVTALSALTVQMLPDLRVASVSASGGLLSGENMTVSWQVTNAGGGPTRNGWSDRVRVLNTTTGQTLADTVIAYDPTAAGAGPIPPGGSRSRSFTFRLPDGTPGTGTLQITVTTDYNAQVDEYGGGSGETNNNTSSSATSSLAPYPDLAVTNITGPAATLSNRQINLSWKVSNTGNKQATGNWQDDVYLSTSPAGIGRQFFASFPFSGTIPVGGSVTRAQVISLPADFSGDWYVVVVTNPVNSPFENITGNNTGISASPVHVTLAPFPNLIVSSVTPPTGAFSSQQTVVRWTVKNIGDGPTSTPVWSDGVYLSNDQVLDAGDTLLGVAGNASYLNPTESYANSLAVTLPRGIGGDYYFLIKTDVNNNVFELHGENDNLANGASTHVTLTPPPDFQVTAVTTPSTVFSGQATTVNWTVVNNGPGRNLETSWSDQVFISTKNTLDSSAISLGTLSHSGALNPGDTYSSNLQVTLPVGISGNYYFLVRTDTFNNVYEHAFENNNVGAKSTTTTVRLTPPPDLAVSSVDAPLGALAGRPITVGYRVDNDGATITPNNVWTDAFYLSTDNVFNPASDRLIGTQTRYGALDAGAGESRSATFTLPIGLTGTFYAFVVSDSANQVFELNKANNVGFDPNAVTIVVNPPDLVINSLQISAGDGSVAEAGTSLLANFGVRNAGAGDTYGGSWTDSIVLSSDGILGNGDDRTLGSITHAGVLAAGDLYSRSQVVALPFDVAAGNYFVFAVADAGNNVFEGTSEGNNSSTPVSVTVTRHTADLQVLSVTATPTLASGQSLAVNWVAKNFGDGKTNSSYWYDSIYLSTDLTIGGSDLLLGSIQRSGTLAPGEQYTRSSNFTLPIDLSGEYYVLVRTDSGNQVFEPGLETNNDGATTAVTRVSLSPVPDLQLAHATAAVEAFSGRPLSVNWTVKNGGTSDAAGTWFDAVYLSPDQIFDPRSDTYLGFSQHTGGLAQGQSYASSGNFNIPQGLSGLYYVFVQTDSSDRVYERGQELNNVAFAIGAAPPGSTVPDTTLITLTAPADLLIGSITIPAVGTPGRNASITYTVQNQGSNPARGQWYDSIFLSADDKWDLSDSLFARVLHVGDVAGGASYTAIASAPLPGVTPGEYHVIIRTDILNHIAESDEENNVHASLDQTTIDVDPLTLGSHDTGELSRDQSIYYRIKVSAGETVLISLDTGTSGFSGELYARFGNLPSRSTSFDFSSSQPFSGKQQILIPVTREGTYYILAYGASTAAPLHASYEIQAKAIDFQLLSVSPTAAGNAGQVTLAIRGAKLEQDTIFRLERSGSAIRSSHVYWTDGTSAYVTFNLFGASPGAYDLVAERSGRVSRLPMSVAVQSGGPGQLQGYISGPPQVRPGRVNRMQVNYGNAGSDDLPSPLMVISTSTGTPFHLLRKGFGTDRVFLIGLAPDGPANVLRPGASASYDIDFNSTTNPIAYNLQFIQSTDSHALDLATLVEPLRPSAIDDSQWDQCIAALAARINGRDSVPGPTLGELTLFLGETAQRLASQGQRVTDVKELLGHELLSAVGLGRGSIAGQFLDSASGVPVKGVSIVARSSTLGTLSGPQWVTTDASGYFRIDDLPVGNYSLVAIGKALSVAVNATSTAGKQTDGLILRGAPRFTVPELSTTAFGIASTLALAASPSPSTPTPGNHSSTLDEATRVYGTANITGPDGFAANIALGSDGNIHVAFRGTEPTQPGDVYTDLNLTMPQWSQNRDQVFAAVDSLLAANPDAKLVVSGHSLGGGLAQLFTYDAVRLKHVDADQFQLVDTFNGVGVRDAIIERDGIYDSDFAAGIPINHFSANGDLVSRLGGGHVGDTLPYVVGDATMFLPAHSTGHLALVESEFASPRGQLSESEYLTVESSRQLLAAFADFGNFDQNDTSFESAARMVAAIALLPHADATSINSLVNFFANNARDSHPGLIGETAYTLLTSVNWPAVLDALNSVGASRVTDVIAGGALITAIIIDRGVAVGKDAIDFVEAIPQAIADFTHKLEDAAERVGDAVSDAYHAAADEVSDIYNRVRDTIDSAWDAATDYAEHRIDDLVDITNRAEDALSHKLQDLRNDLSNFFDSAVEGTRDRAKSLADSAFDFLGHLLDDFVCHTFGGVVGCCDSDCGPDDDGDGMGNNGPGGPYNPSVVVPRDPNDILGPLGSGTPRWVSASDLLRYTIHFENDPVFATAPAQSVRITQKLDPDLDLRTFRLGDFGFGDLVVHVPANRAFYITRLDLRATAGIFVDVAAGIDVSTGEAFWQFDSIDPATGEAPSDAAKGFLPINTTGPAGEGFVNYSVKASSSTTSGTRVDALATIIFDTQPPLDTPAIFNTLDVVGPISTVVNLPAHITDTTFTVTWEGQDDEEGSGLATFDVYISDNGAPFTLWQGATTLTAALFKGDEGHTYSFYTRAHDNAGNVEDSPEAADASTTTPIFNQKPAVDVGGGSTSITEGALFGGLGSFTDPDAGDTWNATVDYGDGTGPQTLALNPDKTFNLTHRYRDNTVGGYDVLVTIVDRKGAFGTKSIHVDVLNAAPTPSMIGLPLAGVTGVPISLGSSVSDPSDTDTGFGFTRAWTVILDGTVVAAGSSSSFAFTPIQPGAYLITLTATDKDGGVGTATATINVAAPAPVVESFVVNGGEVQRSKVTELKVVFSRPVTLGAGAFTLTRRANRAASAFIDVSSQFTAENPSGDGRTWIFRFSGAGTEFGMSAADLLHRSLTDGWYTLTVLSSAVHDAVTGALLGGGDQQYTFYRVFGDSDGNGRIDSVDVGAARTALNSTVGQAKYRAFLDYDMNGTIASDPDYKQVYSRLGVDVLR